MARNRQFTIELTGEGIPDGYAVDTPESIFHRAMVAIYDYMLLERRYDADRFLRLLVAEGGVKTAREFLSSPGFGPGFEGLWKRGPLDKTLEYLVLQARFSGLFTDTEKETARNRLLECGYFQDSAK
jgi:hypothetical protein